MTKPKGEFGEKIQCLECGRWYVALGAHLALKHSLTGDEYREKHGLRKGEPLAGDDYRVSSSKRMKASGIGQRFKHNLRRDAALPAGFKRRPKDKESRRESHLKLARMGTEAARHVDRLGPRLALLPPFPVTRVEAAGRLNCTQSAADTFLAYCVKYGRLVRVRRGVFDLPQGPAAGETPGKEGDS